MAPSDYLCNKSLSGKTRNSKGLVSRPVGSGPLFLFFGREVWPTAIISPEKNRTETFFPPPFRSGGLDSSSALPCQQYLFIESTPAGEISLLVVIVEELWCIHRGSTLCMCTSWQQCRMQCIQASARPVLPLSFSAGVERTAFSGFFPRRVTEIDVVDDGRPVGSNRANSFLVSLFTCAVLFTQSLSFCFHRRPQQDRKTYPSHFYFIPPPPQKKDKENDNETTSDCLEPPPRLLPARYRHLLSTRTKGK